MASNRSRSPLGRNRRFRESSDRRDEYSDRRDDRRDEYSDRRYSDRRGAYSHRQDRYSDRYSDRDRRSPSLPKLRPKVRDDEPPEDPQKEFFEWAKSKRHKETWLLTGRALVDPDYSRGSKILSVMGSKILLEGFNTSETKVIELRAEVQLMRGKISAPLRKTEGDEKTNPSEEELKSGRKTILTKIILLSDSQVIPAEVNAEKQVAYPTLIIRGILEHAEGSKDQEKAFERAKQMLFFPPNWTPGKLPGQLQLLG
jgi:hypothetical protein